MQVHIPKLLKEDGDYLLLETGDKIILNPIEAETTAVVSVVGSALVESLRVYFQEVLANIKASAEVTNVSAIIISAIVNPTIEIMKGFTIEAKIVARTIITSNLNKTINAVVSAVAKLKEMFYKTKYEKQNDKYTKKY